MISRIARWIGLLGITLVLAIGLAAVAQVLPPGGTFLDDDGIVHEFDIEGLVAAGITTGCDEELFCPDDPVTRGQMAAFLRRSLELPTSSDDPFSDDDMSVFEGDIAALAASGITTGCDTGLFCPDDSVTRGQMAAFLRRGLDLPPATADHFPDDNASVFEGDINALAESGITKGCTDESFCADDEVTRGQMASFLVRGLDDVDPIEVEPRPSTTTSTTTAPLPCDPSYPDHCIPPPPPDLDCPDIPWTNFRVLPPDPHGFDGNNDGVGCET